MELLKLAHSELLRSNVDRRHPFRYFCLATKGLYAEVRTVVKREMDADWNIWFYTDSRSPKVDQIKKDNRVSALFYHPKKQLQVRIKGTAELLEDGHEDFGQFLQRVEQAGGLKDYTTTATPGSPLPDEAEILFGPDVHFAAVKIQALYVDVLLLGRERHQRVAQSLIDGQWVACALTP